MTDIYSIKPLSTVPGSRTPVKNTGVKLAVSDPNRTAPDEKKESEMARACAEFESLFMYYMIKEMRATVPDSSFLSGGKAESMVTSMLDMQLAKEVSIKRSIGLADFFKDQLSRADKSVEP